jgi:hypothetical protein
MKGERTRLWACGAASILLHAAMLGPAAVQTLSAPRENAATEDPAESVAQPPLADELTLGLDQPPNTSVTWIGYDTYQEHLARLSETEQAAFKTEEDAGAAQPPMASEPAPAGEPEAADEAAEAVAIEPPTPTAPMQEPPPEVQPSEQPTPAEAAPPNPLEVSPQPPSPAPLEPAESDPMEPAISEPPPELEDPSLTPGPPELPPVDADRPPVDPVPDALEAIPVPPSDPNAVAEFLNRVLEAIMASENTQEQLPRDPQPPPASTPGPTQPSESEPREAQVPPGSTPSPPSSSPGAPSQQPPAPGETSDRESDPTSIVNVPPENWKLGKPLAAQGLDIRTRRPRFDELTRITASPRNPVARVTFDHKGVAVKVALLVSSGDHRVDEPVINALYAWKAKGDKIDRLKEKQTVAIEIRIILGD